MVQLNKALDLVEPSKSVTLLARTKELQQTDPNILNFTGGEPDFPTPDPICEEVYRQLKAGGTHYGDSKGDIELRRQISRKLAEDNNAPYSPDQILVTPGGKYAIYAAIQAMINPGDEVLWLTPGWVSYPAIVTLCGGKPVAVHLDYDQDYALSTEQLEAHTTDKTKLLIINYPNNPTGKILSGNDLKELKDWLRRHPDIFVLSDEIYEKIIYDGKKSISIASDPEFFDRTLVVNGFSKCSAMTGWRIGYLACPTRIYAGALKIFQHSMSCTSSFIQKGAIVALAHPEETERMRKAYEHRCNLVYEGLKEIPGIEIVKPDGAFYAWIKFDTGLSSEEICSRLLDEAKIAGIPGAAYGEEKKCMVRICFASGDEALTEMIRRMKIFCRNL